MRRREKELAPILRQIALFAVVTSLFSYASDASAGAFVFAGEANGVDLVTHPTGYTGTGGTLDVSVCIDPTSANAASMEIPVRNIIYTWNERLPTTGNLKLGVLNDVPAGNVDFESVALHELGHCIGAAHPNLASESGLSDPQANSTKSTDGPDGFDTNSGADATYGSSDDPRGNDVNLHWFRKSNNDPFTIDTTVDSSTYSRDLADLPVGHNFAANGDRSVASLLGAGATEAVMQQGTFSDEDQRRLTHDDVATIEYAMSGLDETSGNSDDYALNLTYAGLTNSCDIVIDFDNAETGFAVCQTGGSFIGTSGHVRITSAEIYFNTGFSWYFNPTLTAPITIQHEEVETGTASSSSSVTTSAPLTATTDHLYLAAVSYRPDTSVSSVSGLGLTWTLVAEQCAGASQTEVSVWQAIGTPTGDGTVTATLAASVGRSVITVSRYSGVNPSTPTAGVVQGNTNGVDGACSGGSDTSSYGFNVTTTADGSRVYGAVAIRQRSHSPGSGFTERAEVRSGNGNSAAGVAVEDQLVATPAATLVDGSLSSSSDWAFVGLEIVAACTDDLECDDGLFCNGSETCSSGSCVAGAPVACGDGVSCTLDSDSARATSSRKRRTAAGFVRSTRKSQKRWRCQLQYCCRWVL